MRIARSSPREPPRARRASSSPATWTRPSSLEPSTSERAQAAPPPLPTDASRPWSRRRCPRRVAPPPSSFVATFGEPANACSKTTRRPSSTRGIAAFDSTTTTRTIRTQRVLVHVLAIRRRGARVPRRRRRARRPRAGSSGAGTQTRGITKTTRRGRNLPGFEPGAISESARGTTTPARERRGGDPRRFGFHLARRRRGEDGRVGVFRVSARAAEDHARVRCERSSRRRARCHRRRRRRRSWRRSTRRETRCLTRTAPTCAVRRCCCTPRGEHKPKLLPLREAGKGRGRRGGGAHAGRCAGTVSSAGVRSGRGEAAGEAFVAADAEALEGRGRRRREDDDEL